MLPRTPLRMAISASLTGVFAWTAHAGAGAAPATGAAAAPAADAVPDPGAVAVPAAPPDAPTAFRLARQRSPPSSATRGCPPTATSDPPAWATDSREPLSATPPVDPAPAGPATARPGRLRVDAAGDTIGPAAAASRSASL